MWFDQRAGKRESRDLLESRLTCGMQRINLFKVELYEVRKFCMNQSKLTNQAYLYYYERRIRL